MEAGAIHGKEMYKQKGLDSTIDRIFFFNGLNVISIRISTTIDGERRRIEIKATDLLNCGAEGCLFDATLGFWDGTEYLLQSPEEEPKCVKFVIFKTKDRARFQNEVTIGNIIGRASNKKERIGPRLFFAFNTPVNKLGVDQRSGVKYITSINNFISQQIKSVEIFPEMLIKTLKYDTAELSLGLIVMENLQGNMLYKIPQTPSIMSSVRTLVDKLHNDFEYVHGDLSPANIIIQTSRGLEGVPRLIDMGWSYKVDGRTALPSNVVPGRNKTLGNYINDGQGGNYTTDKNQYCLKASWPCEAAAGRQFGIAGAMAAVLPPTGEMDLSNTGYMPETRP
jgi:hypothetical protein